MLQVGKSYPIEPEESGLAPDGPSLAELLSAVIGFTRRQFAVVFLGVVAVIVLAAVYLFVTPPQYSAQARILIDAGNVQLFQQSMIGEEPINAAVVDSQIEILKSENFAQQVIKKLNLTEDPEFVGAPGGIMDAIGAAKHLVSTLLGKKKNQLPPGLATLQQAMITFDGRLKVTRVGITYVIDISFRSTNPDRAAEIANGVAEEYIADQLEAKFRTIRNATTWMENRLNELRSDALVAERAVVDYKTKNNIVDAGGRLVNEQQVSELNSALVTAYASSAEAKARFDRISNVLQSGDIDPGNPEIATFADTLHNEIISRFRQQYLELGQREGLLSNRLGNNHLAVVSIRNQKREIARSMFEEFKRMAAAYKSDYDIAKARETALQKSLDATVLESQTANKAQVGLRDLEGKAQSYRTLYDSFQQRYALTMQQQSFPMTQARIITRALRPSQKSYPKTMLILAGAIAGGLGLGVGMGFLRELLDRRFRTSRQVEARLKTECIALVPRVAVNGKAKDISTRNTVNRSTSRILPPNVGLLQQVIDRPLSRFAESLRAIKVTADQSGGGKSNKVIGITSSLPNEGKSTISACLAHLCASSGARVILVDCDLRKPSLSSEPYTGRNRRARRCC